MSYASEQKRTSATGMAAAILLNGSIILAVALSPMVAEPRLPGGIIIGEAIPLDPPREPKPDEQKEARVLPPIFVVKPMTKALDNKVEIKTSADEQITGQIMDGAGGGDDDMTEIVREIVRPTPVFKAAERDARFARSFQPDYPLGMLRQEIEGSVTVRVLVGTDGRVRQVQIIRATDPDFARSTERQALKAWRFKPASRDGQPVEDWQTLTVRFDIN